MSCIPQDDNERFITEEELAARLGYNVEHVQRLRREGKDLPPHYVFGRKIRYWLPDVLLWIDAHRVPPAGGPKAPVGALGGGSRPEDPQVPQAAHPAQPGELAPGEGGKSAALREPEGRA